MDEFGDLFDAVLRPDDDFDVEGLTEAPTEFYAQVILSVMDHAPLLANPRLARLTMRAVQDCVPDAPGVVWGYTVLPDTVRLIVGPTDENALEAFVMQLKGHTTHQLLAAILRADDESLDYVLRYNPVRGGAIYQVWQAGSHRAIFWTEYKLSNALYDLRQMPVALGLSGSAAAWPYCYVGGGSSV